MSIIIGSAQFGLDYGISNTSGIVSVEMVDRIIDFASENGVSEIDTAVNYGSSHQAIGMSEHGLEISSKLPLIDINKKDIFNQIHKIFLKSLNELNISKLKTLYLHSPEQLLGKNGDQIFEVLLSLKSENLIKNIGISVYNPGDVIKTIENFDIDVVQLPFNLVDRRFEEDNLLAKLKEKKIEVNCRSIFLQGLLLMPLNEIPSYFEKWSWLFSSWSDWLKKNNINPVDACISYAAMNENIDNIIIGIQSSDQLAQILSFYNSDNLKNSTFPNIKSDDPFLVNPSFWDTD